MARTRPTFIAAAPPTTVTEYVKLLRCPDCDRLLRARGGAATAPTFHCTRCHHTWSWQTRDARRAVIKVTRTLRDDERKNRPLTRWR